MITDNRCATTFQDSDIPLAILTEVTSLYPGRGVNGATEVLIAAGTSTFGPESHPTMGWGVLYSLVGPLQHEYQGVVRQAHRESSVVETFRNHGATHLQCGQRVKIRPFNAANASQSFGWYFVVDSSRTGYGDEIIDIFVRWRD